MKKRQSKKAVSTTVATAFIIVLTITIIVFAANIVYDLVKEKTSEAEEGANCIRGTEMDILNACKNGNLLEITLKNKRDKILGDFLLILITYKDETTELIPSPYHTYIQPYETKKITIPYKENTQKIKITPKIEEESYLCEKFAPEYENIQECT